MILTVKRMLFMHAKSITFITLILIHYLETLLRVFPLRLSNDPKLY